MNLGNRGWSLKEMLFFSSILLFSVFLVAMLINNLYSGLFPEKLPEVTSYSKIEMNLKNASQKYYNLHKSEVGDLITSEILLSENFLTNIDLTNGQDVCEGYVILNQGIFSPYIKCSNYQTEGY